MHVGEGGDPFWVVFETFCRHGDIETVVGKVECFPSGNKVYAGSGANIHTNIFDGVVVETADGSVDVE